MYLNAHTALFHTTETVKQLKKKKKIKSQKLKLLKINSKIKTQFTHTIT